MNTKPEVFIIESLEPDDEGNGRFEGSIISKLLKLHGKTPIYRYVRTRRQFHEAVRQFGKSGYRYLHISAHGNENGMCTTNQDEINFDKLAAILNPHLKDRRLFLSACSMVHEDLARAIIPHSDCYSVVGPIKGINFSEAAVVWVSIYHLMFAENSRKMVHGTLKKRLLGVCKLFDVKFNYYSRAKKPRCGYTKYLLGV